MVRIGQYPQRFGGDRFRRECFLNQLGHHTPSRHQVRHGV